MKGAPAGKYVVQINPGGEYGGGQTVVDYPGPGGNYHQSWPIDQSAGRFQRGVEHGAEMAPPRAACDNVDLRGRGMSGRACSWRGDGCGIEGRWRLSISMHRQVR